MRPATRWSSKPPNELPKAPVEFRQATARFEHEEARQNMEVSSQPIPSSVATTPELLQRIDLAHKDGRYQLRLFGQDDPDEIAAVSVMTYPELHQFLHLIHAGADRLDWDAPELFPGPISGQPPTLQ